MANFCLGGGCCMRCCIPPNVPPKLHSYLTKRLNLLIKMEDMSRRLNAFLTRPGRALTFSRLSACITLNLKSISL